MIRFQSSRLSAEALAATARELPPLANTTSRIIDILGDPMFEVSELIKVIALDPVLTAKLLRLANSAACGIFRPAATVGDAIVRLGSGTVLTLALSTTGKPPAEADLSAFGLTTQSYWRHCVASVAAAEELAARRVAKFGSGLSAAALLHDFGKLILARHLTPERSALMAEFLATHPGRCSIDAEREILGVDHALAGAVVTRHWKLPEEISMAIQNHHNPPDWEQDLWNGVILANQIALENDGHPDVSIDTLESVADAIMALGVDDQTYQSIAKASQDRFQQLLDLFD